MSGVACSDPLKYTHVAMTLSALQQPLQDHHALILSYLTYLFCLNMLFTYFSVSYEIADV